MARTDSLCHFLTDIANAIRTKKGTSNPINASDFDTEIGSISGSDTSVETDIYKTSSIEKMMDLSNAKEHDTCVVIGKKQERITRQFTSGTISFPDNVALPSVISRSYNTTIQGDDSYLSINLNQTSVMIDYTNFQTGEDFMIEYESQDGINYTKTSGVNSVEMNDVYISSLNTNLTYFMLLEEEDFKGIYSLESKNYYDVVSRKGKSARFYTLYSMDKQDWLLEIIYDYKVDNIGVVNSYKSFIVNSSSTSYTTDGYLYYDGSDIYYSKNASNASTNYGTCIYDGYNYDVNTTNSTNTLIKIAENVDDFIIVARDKLGEIKIYNPSKSSVICQSSGEPQQINSLMWQTIDVGVSAKDYNIQVGYEAYIGKGKTEGTFGTNSLDSNSYNELDMLYRLIDKVPSFYPTNMNFLSTSYNKNEATSVEWAFENINVDNISNMSISGLNNITELDLTTLYERIAGSNDSVKMQYNLKCISNCANLKTLKGFNALNKFSNSKSNNGYFCFDGFISSCPELETIDLTGFTGLDKNGQSLFTGVLQGFIKDCPKVEEINAPDLKFIGRGSNIWSLLVYGTNNVRRISMPSMTFNNSSGTADFRLFQGLSKLEFLDIRGGTFTGSTFNQYSFLNVPNDCLIIVKNDTVRNNILSSSPNLTNIKTVSEYENQ